MLFERKGKDITLSFEHHKLGCVVKLEKWSKEKQESEIEIKLFEDEIEQLIGWLERSKMLLEGGF